VRNLINARTNNVAVTLNGMGGDDRLDGSNYGDTLNGGEGKDVMFGYAALTGVNTMNGGRADDVYYSFTASDVINENFNEGYEVVYTIVNRTLSANTEYLYLYGLAVTGTGNGLANIINGYNSSQSMTLDGGAGNDTLYGSQQSDTLIGGADNDQLFGYNGLNQMQGGGGNDIYYSQSLTDVVTENFNEGFDILYSTVSVAALAANVERLIIYGGAVSGVGNGLDNLLNGNNSALGVTLDGAGGNDNIVGSNQSDVLIGGAGADALNGISGDDFFRFAAAGTGVDRIIGFDADAAGGQDKIDVAGRGFSAASIGGAILIAASGADTLITIGADTIRLLGISAANVDAGDFVF
jgi:Ca2+-binding RTX toxin-like protein